MAPLDLKKFVWEKDGKSYLILAITDYKSDDVVVYREAVDRSVICVTSVDDFCRDFQATYDIS